MKEVFHNIKSYTRNPLGIIALFISLIYGFASLVLGFASSNLTSCERLILIWFLVIFPIIILLSFIFLVVFHHKKLYSPMDFREDKSFLELASSPAKVIKEFAEYVQHADVEGSTSDTKNLRQDQNYTLSFTEFKDSYLLAESLTLAYYERKYGSYLVKDELFFDGVIELDDRIIGIEVKYLPGLSISESQLKSIISNAVLFKSIASQSNKTKRIEFVIALVFSSKRLDFNYSKVKQLKKLLPADIQISIDTHHLESLKSQFGIDQ